MFYRMKHRTEKFYKTAVETLIELEKEERLRVFNVKNLKTLDEIGYFDFSENDN